MKELQVQQNIFSHFNRAVIEHLRAESGKLEHFVVSDFIKLLSTLNLAGICGVNALNIGEDLASVRMKGSCDCNGGGIRTAAAERCEVVISVKPLEACHNNDVVLCKLCLKAICFYIFNAGGTVNRIGVEARLPAEKRDNGIAKLFDSHCKQ